MCPQDAGVRSGGSTLPGGVVFGFLARGPTGRAQGGLGQGLLCGGTEPLGSFPLTGRGQQPSTSLLTWTACLLPKGR